MSPLVSLFLRVYEKSASFGTTYRALRRRTPAFSNVFFLSGSGMLLALPLCSKNKCEVLQICLRHLQEDASERPSLFPRSLLHALRRVSSFAYVRRRSPCRRCMPAEILAAYLTPGEEVVPTGRGNIPALSWVNGDEEMHW